MIGIARLASTGLVVMALLLGSNARADNPPISIDDLGRALRGYDSVAYFTDGRAEAGNAAFTHNWSDVTWLFASAANRDAFAADPERYAPQFGGYCAYAVSRGHVLTANPKVWSITDGKLYVFLGPDAQSRKEKIMIGLARLVSTGLVVMALLLGSNARADNPPISIDDLGRALRGYDSVAYFTDGRAEAGNAAFTHNWSDVTWLFASAANRDAFAADPERYAPQFGGYCAYAVSRGHVLTANPKVWSITDGKLYVFLGPDAQSRWNKDVPGNIASAVNNWPDALIDEGRRQSTPTEGSDR